MSDRTHPRSAHGYPPAFVEAILDDALDNAARVYAITGLQGTGKSTLSAQLADLALQRDVRVAVVSIDDVYLDHDQRARLGAEVHPLLATRGPPGTHDVDLACDTLDALRAGASAPLPRFDKIEDRRVPRDQWPQSGPVDLVILEGWFLKAPAEAVGMLDPPLNALERDEDPDRTWRRFCNQALADDYPRLWQRIDRMLFLHGPGFDVVPGWRWQQEQTLQAANPDRHAMTRPQVERFVQFFERVSRQALRTLPAIAERTIAVDADRKPLL